MPEPSRLRRSDFELIAESIPHIVWLAGADGSTDYFNERGTEYTGLPRQANYGWGWVELVDPRDAERARLGWQVATATATPFELSYRIRRSDGEFRWHGFRALPVRGPRGEVAKWIGTADDLADAAAPHDESSRVERQAAELRALLETIQPFMGEAFGFVRPDVLRARVEAILSPIVRHSAVGASSEGAAHVVSDAPATDGLGAREVAVLRLLARGHTNAEMANLLGISLRSVEASRSRLRRSLGLHTRALLVQYAHESGLVDGTT